MVKSNKPEKEMYAFLIIAIPFILVAISGVKFASVVSIILLSRSLMVSFHKDIRHLDFAIRARAAHILGLAVSVFALFFM